MNKKIGAFLAVLIVVMMLPLWVFAAENEVTNSDFSMMNASGLPMSWTYAAWTVDDAVSTYWTEEVEAGNTCVRLQNFSGNDARLEQEVAVSGNSIYHISARMKAEGGDMEHIGGNISVADTFAISGDWTDTNGEWVTVDLYGKTGFFQGSIVVALRVGFYGEENVGSAWFDDVVVEKVSQVPAGYELQSLKQVAVSASSSDEAHEGADWIPMQTFVSALFIVLLLAAMWRLRGVQFDDHKINVMLMGALVVACVLRLALGASTKGYEVDVNCFTSWGQMLVNYGPADYYAQGFCDYPPGYIYVLGLQALIANALGFAADSAPYLILIKLVPILCDIGAAYLLYKIGRRYIQPAYALLAAVAYAFLPVAIIDSALWGQMDSVLVLLMLLVFDSFLQKKTLRAAILYGVAVMVKPQALMLGTIVLCGYIMEIFENPKKGVQKLAAGIAACIGVMAVIALPFIIKQPITFIFEKYMETLSSYGYASVNALNLFFITGGNWVAQDTVYLGLSYKIWGSIAMVLCVGLSLFFFFKSREHRAIALTTALMLVGVFTLGVRMHERYMFPALALMLLAAVMYNDRRLWWTFAGLSLTNAVNVYIVLQNGHILAENRILGIVIAVLNLLIFFYLIEVCVDLCVRKAVQPVAPEKGRARLGRQVLGARLPDASAGGDRASTRMGRADYIIMIALTVLYACFAFYQLGDTTAPSTLWTGADGDRVVIDLGEVKELSQFRYYGEIPYGDFEVSVSEDNINWSGAIEQSVGVHDMFKWHSVDLTQQSARYVQLNVVNDEIKLFEVGVFGADGELLPVASCNADLLVDEQAIVPAQVSYMNGMYFDEVYHGRTAYEQINNMEWYENTHPPLGKVFISWSIMLFGMTPFGWRFAGTLAGVLMVPAMYLLCKQLFRKPLLATLGTVLMTFDFMHLAQTRLGTIDSYPVLFIILGFYFMIRYAYTSFYHDKFWKTLIPLLFSGIFMGLGMASKWIGIYAALGLAVLFFCIFGTRAKEYVVARRTLKMEEITAAKREECEKIAALFPKKALWTLLACVLFFIIIPLGIYVASYYQFLRIDAPRHGLKEVWNYQLHMFNYHKGVFDSHPFESPWWQWPLNIRNIWYYVSDSMPQGWVSTISALGNPVVWWMGLASLVWVIVRAIKGYGKRDPRLWWVIIGFCANYLPWVMVPRVTFVYHYFASVPFIILATVLFFEDLFDKTKWAKTAVYVVMGVVVALFLLFYPALTGVPMTSFHASLLKWLPSWVLA